MNWFDELMDYSKECYRVLKGNKVIFIPYVMLLIFKLLAFVAISVIGLKIAKGFAAGTLVKDDFLQFAHLTPQIFFGGAIIGLVALLIISFFDAGTSSMLMLAVRGETVGLEDFWEGGKYFWGRILGGHLLIIISSLVLSPLLMGILVIVGIFTLGLGFLVLPLMMGVFLGMWKVSLVAEDSDILTSLKNSLRFGRDQFWPFLFVNFIVTLTKSFSSFGGGDNSRGVNIDLSQRNIKGIPSYFATEGLKWVIALGTAIFGVLFFISSLIKMVLNVFFDSFFFVYYLHKR